MVNDRKKKFSLLLVGKCIKSTIPSARRCHQANESNRGLDGDSSGAHGALRSVRSNKKIAVQTLREMHFVSKEEQVKSIDDCMETESTLGTKLGTDTETAIKHEQKDTRNDENPGLTTREPKHMV